jgi:hypothetical protein
MRVLGLLLLWAGICGQAIAQIVDDTTKTIKGYQTMVYITPAQIHIDSAKNRLDTTIIGLQETDESLWANGVRQRNLGFIGSAQSPLFFANQANVGYWMGQDNTRYLSFPADSVRFYRTYNTYSNIRYNQGSFGRQWILIDFDRNLSVNTNFGFSIRRLTEQRILGVVSRKQKMLDHTSFNFHANGTYWDGRMRAFASYSDFRQGIGETGGAYLNDTSDLAVVYDYTRNQAVYAAGTTSGEYRRNFRTYLLLGKDSAAIRFRVDAGYEGYKYSYTSDLTTTASVASQKYLPYYETFFLNYSSTNNDYRYDFLFAKPAVYVHVPSGFLSAGIETRQHRYANQQLLIAAKKENILFVQGEQKVGPVRADFLGRIIFGRDYGAKVGLHAPFLEGFFETYKSTPSFMSQRMISNHFIWDNQFSPVYSSKIGGKATLKKGQSYLSAKLSYDLIHQYIYYSNKVTPVQDSSLLHNINVAIDSRFVYRSFVLTGQATFAKSSNATILPQPAYFFRASPSFLISISGGKYQLNPGLDFWYRGAYNGQAYDPSLALFYNQGATGVRSNTFPPSLNLAPYLWASAFVNIKIGNTRVYLKLGNALQGIVGKGFLDVPFYPGINRYFEFGLNWTFFD